MAKKQDKPVEKKPEKKPPELPTEIADRIALVWCAVLGLPASFKISPMQVTVCMGLADMIRVGADGVLPPVGD